MDSSNIPQFLDPQVYASNGVTTQHQGTSSIISGLGINSPFDGLNIEPSI